MLVSWKNKKSTTFASSASLFSAASINTVPTTPCAVLDTTPCKTDLSTPKGLHTRPSITDDISKLSFTDIVAKLVSLAKSYRQLSTSSRDEQKQEAFTEAANYLEAEQPVIDKLRNATRVMLSLEITPSITRFTGIMKACSTRITNLQQESRVVDEPTKLKSCDYIVFHLKGLSCLSNSENEGTDPKTKAVRELLINFASLVANSVTPGLTHCKTEEEARKELRKHNTGDKAYFTLKGGTVESFTVLDGAFIKMPIKPLTTNEHSTTPYRIPSPGTTA